jgi:hypothetical protein
MALNALARPRRVQKEKKYSFVLYRYFPEWSISLLFCYSYVNRPVYPDRVLSNSDNLRHCAAYM